MGGTLSSVEYQPGDIVRRERRRVRAHLLLGLLLSAAVVLLTAKLAHPVWSRFQQRKLAAELAAQRAAATQKRQAIERQCLAFTSPPRQVIYQEARDVSHLLGLPGYVPVAARLRRGEHTVGARLQPPACWTNLRSGHQGASVVFLHERTTPSGNTRLVGVEFHASKSGVFLPAEPDRHKLYALRSFTAWVVAPGADRHEALLGNSILSLLPRRDPIERGWERRCDFRGEVRLRRSPVAEVLEYARLTEFSVFAGQPDDFDSSHFTVEYVYNGQNGIIDGWLTDNDEVNLAPREGLRTLRRRSITDEWDWDPTASRPATAPAIAR